jgi:hypothetical protein
MAGNLRPAAGRDKEGPAITSPKVQPWYPVGVLGRVGHHRAFPKMRAMTTPAPSIWTK